MKIEFDPLKSIEFQREFFTNAIKRSNARKASEMQQIQSEELELTPAEIGKAQRRLRLSNLNQNLLNRFIDTYV